MAQLYSRSYYLLLLILSFNYFNVKYLLNLSPPPSFRSPNPHLLFTDLQHACSFYLIPSPNLSVAPHVMLFLNSSVRRHPNSSYPPTLYPCLHLRFFLLLLLAGDIQLNPGPPMLNFTHLNIRSICNKSAPLHNYLYAHPTDFLSINETWIKPDEHSPSFIFSLIPPQYSILHSPRLTGQKGGGVAIIFRSYLKLTRIPYPLPLPKSFEFLTSKDLGKGKG